MCCFFGTSRLCCSGPVLKWLCANLYVVYLLMYTHRENWELMILLPDIVAFKMPLDGSLISLESNYMQIKT